MWLIIACILAFHLICALGFLALTRFSTKRLEEAPVRERPRANV